MRREKLREKVATILDQTRLSQTTLAKLAEVSNSAVSQWVSGESENMSAEAAFLIQHALGYNAAWLLVGNRSLKDRRFCQHYFVDYATTLLREAPATTSWYKRRSTL